MGQPDDVARAVRSYISRVEARTLADIACWQHWLEDDVFGTLEDWRNRPLEERYATGARKADEAYLAGV